jgi:hypothetical protein
MMSGLTSLSFLFILRMWGGGIGRLLVEWWDRRIERRQRQGTISSINNNENTSEGI